MKPERIEELQATLAKHDPDTSWGNITTTDELLHLLRCARAWAELGEWLMSEPHYDHLLEAQGPHARATRREIDLTLYQGGHHGTTQDVAGDAQGPDLLTAVEDALRASRGEAAPRPEGEMARAKETT